MKIVNPELLAEFRHGGRCEYCHKQCKLLEPHHIFTRGAGQLDIRVNLIALGSTRGFPQCDCHPSAHSGEITRNDFLIAVAHRHKLKAYQVEEIVFCLRDRLVKSPTQTQIVKAMEGLSAGARSIVQSELRRLELWE